MDNEIPESLEALLDEVIDRATLPASDHRRCVLCCNFVAEKNYTRFIGIVSHDEDFIQELYDALKEDPLMRHSRNLRVLTTRTGESILLETGSGLKPGEAPATQDWRETGDFVAAFKDLLDDAHERIRQVPLPIEPLNTEFFAQLQRSITLHYTSAIRSDSDSAEKGR